MALWFLLRGVSCRVLPCSLFLCFSIVITSFGEERAGLWSSHAFVCLFCTSQFLTFFSSSWCQGLAAACDCGNPWTFLLNFLEFGIMAYSIITRLCVFVLELQKPPT